MPGLRPGMPPMMPGMFPSGVIPPPPSTSSPANIPIPGQSQGTPPLPPQAAFAAYQGDANKEETTEQKPQNLTAAGPSTSKGLTGAKTRIACPDEFTSLVSKFSIYLIHQKTGRADGATHCSPICTRDCRPLSSIVK